MGKNETIKVTVSLNATGDEDFQFDASKTYTFGPSKKFTAKDKVRALELFYLEVEQQLTAMGDDDWSELFERHGAKPTKG